MAYPNLNESDWVEFKKSYPVASLWLGRRELSREREALERDKDKPWFNDWQRARMKELNDLRARDGIDCLDPTNCDNCSCSNTAGKPGGGK